MRNNRSNNTDGWMILVIYAIAVIAFTIWKFSTYFGLDINSGTSVFLRLIVIAALAGASWKFGDEYELIRLGNIWPILLALFWFCWWPALDYWAINQSPSFLSSDEISLWWNAWYTKLGVFAAIIGFGYTIKNMQLDD